MKSKDISREEYVKEYCRDRRIRDRRVVYVDSDTHEKLKRIVRLFRGEYQTVASLADAIITRHIATYKSLFNRLEEEHYQTVRKEILGISKPAGEPEDDYEDEPV